MEKIDAADYYAATELAAKFKSREALYKYFNIDFTNTSEATCKDINQNAYNYVV